MAEVELFDFTAAAEEAVQKALDKITPKSKEEKKMNYNDTFPTVTTMNPPDPNSDPDTVKVFLRMTDERLCKAIELSEAILEAVGGAIVKKDEPPRDTSNLIAVTGYHVDLTERLFMNLKKISDLIGWHA